MIRQKDSLRQKRYIFNWHLIDVVHKFVKAIPQYFPLKKPFLLDFK
jgi:hypothetical protein